MCGICCGFVCFCWFLWLICILFCVSVVRLWLGFGVCLGLDCVFMLFCVLIVLVTVVLWFGLFVCVLWFGWVVFVLLVCCV